MAVLTIGGTSRVHVEVFPAASLPESLQQQWDACRHGSVELASPFMCAGFTRAVAAVRDDAYVALASRDGSPFAFFPFHRSALGIGAPIGMHLSDAHGIVCAPGTKIDVPGLMRRAGLAVWPFDHLVAPIPAFARYAESETVSPIIDVSGGFEHYAGQLAARGSDIAKRVAYQDRRMARELGPLRFEAHTREPEVLASLLRWKSRQYVESGIDDNFRHAWIRSFVERLPEIDTPQFAGMLSGLWAGDRLLAVHLGMRSSSTWHYWLTTYDRELAKYSPGLSLLWQMAQTAPSLGLARIDLGKGAADYKDRFANASVPLLEGHVDRSIALRGLRAGQRALAAWIRRTPAVFTLARRTRRAWRDLRNRPPDG